MVKRTSILATIFGVVMFFAGLIGLVALPDDFTLLVDRVMSITIVHVAIGLSSAALLVLLLNLLQMAIDDLPPKWNPWKKRALKKLVPIIENQFNGGRSLVGYVVSQTEPGFISEYVMLRASLRDLGIKHPDAQPGCPEWGWWIGFLEALLPLAADGKLEAARNLSRKPEGNNQPDP